MNSKAVLAFSSFLDADEVDYQDFKCKELTDEIIKIFYRVYNKLGYGFLEKVLNFSIKPEVIRCLII